MQFFSLGEGKNTHTHIFSRWGGGFVGCGEARGGEGSESKAGHDGGNTGVPGESGCKKKHTRFFALEQKPLAVTRVRLMLSKADRAPPLQMPLQD